MFVPENGYRKVNLMKIFYGSKVRSSDQQKKVVYAIVEDDAATELFQCSSCGQEYISNTPSENCPFCGSNAPVIDKGFLTE